MLDSNAVACKYNQFNKVDWIELYGYIKEEVHPNAPEERVIPLQYSGFMETYNA